jgi:hypothetical protein
LGRLTIPSSDEDFDKLSEIGNKKSRIIKMNEIAYTELILSIHVKTSSGKTAVNIVKRCNTKDHTDGNAATAWEKLKSKYEPVSAPTLVKLENQFRELSLNYPRVSWTTLIQRTLLEERSRSRDLDYGVRRPSSQA